MPNVFLKWDGRCLDRALTEQRITQYWCNTVDEDGGKKGKKGRGFEVRGGSGEKGSSPVALVGIASTTQLFEPGAEFVEIEAQFTSVERLGCLVLQVRDNSGTLVYAERLGFKQVRALPTAKGGAPGPKPVSDDVYWATVAKSPYRISLLIGDTRLGEPRRIRGLPDLDADPNRLPRGARSDVPLGYSVRSRDDRRLGQQSGAITAVKAPKMQVPAELPYLAAIASKAVTVPIKNVGTGPLKLGEISIPRPFAAADDNTVVAGNEIGVGITVGLKLKLDRPTTRTALTDDELANIYGKKVLTIASNDVEQPLRTVLAKLDAGATLLSGLARPDPVNNAGADKLSNCALTTMAGVTGGMTSGEMAAALRTPRGLDKTTEQSQKIWAMTMLDDVEVTKAGLKGPTDMITVNKRKKIYDADKDTVKSLEEMPEAAAFVVGDAQFYGMQRFLLDLAERAATGQVTYRLVEHGEPGNQMDDEADLVGKMKAYPSGTRFAVFVYSSVPDQHVRAHWIYAENLGGLVVFRDFQVNTSVRLRPGSYLDQLPFSPDTAKDAGKTFEKGCFMALVPTFAPALPAPLPDPLVDADKVDNILAGVAYRMSTLVAQFKATGDKLPKGWPVIGARPLDCIPAPSLVNSTLVDLVVLLGCVRKQSQFNLQEEGVIKVMGAPVHKADRSRVKVKVGIEYEWVWTERDVLNFSPIPGLPVVKSGAAPARDDVELPPCADEPFVEPEYEAAFSKTYNVQAQNTSDGIELNSTNIEFTDLIHEATHSFETRVMPAPFKEGLCDLFGAMATHKLKADGAGDKFAYAYNPSYAPFVAAIHALLPLVGLPVLARAYFSEAEHKDYLEQAITPTVVGGTDVKAILADLYAGLEAFPAKFYQGVEKLRLARANQAALPGLTIDQQRLLTLHETAFTEFLRLRAAEYDHKYKQNLTAGTERVKAEGADHWYGVEVMERRLKILYQHKPSVTGPHLTKLQKLVALHEAGITAVTKETIEVMRKRVLPETTLTFNLTYTPKADEKIYVCGDVAELGDWATDKAIELTLKSADLYTAQIKPTATGIALSYRYLTKKDGKSTWEGRQAHGIVVPVSAPAVLDDVWT